MDYTHMFFVPMIKIDCDNWYLKKNKLKNIQPNLKINNENRNNTVSTDYWDKKPSYSLEIFNIFFDEINLFKNKLDLKSVEIQNSWFEKSFKYNSHEYHHHGPFGYSAVCYVEYCEFSHSPITFVSPFNNFTSGSHMFYRPDNVKEGTIIFFPSSIGHYTLSNTSEKERLVVSFNLLVK